MGLAFPALAAYDHTPVFDNLISQKLLAVPAFAFYYSKLPVQESALFLGGPDPAFYTGEITWTPVKKQFYWEIRLHDILVDGQKMGLCDDTVDGCKIVFDTGTSLVAGPSDDVSSLLERLNIDSGCGNYKHLPTLTFKIGDGEFHLTPDDYVLESTENENDDDAGSASKYCKPGFMPLDVPPPRGPLWILGDLFMRKFYTIFDRSENRVGVANAKEFADLKVRACLLCEALYDHWSTRNSPPLTIVYNDKMIYCIHSFISALSSHHPSLITHH